jgi:hypothetical protein
LFAANQVMAGGWVGDSIKLFDRHPPTSGSSFSQCYPLYPFTRVLEPIHNARLM